MDTNRPQRFQLQLVEDSEPDQIFTAPPTAADIAFQDYKALGSGRSITQLHRNYLIRVQRDPYAPVPTTNIHELVFWETRYNWKTLSWEADMESFNAYAASRKEQLQQVYRDKADRAERMLAKAHAALDALEPGRFSPQDTLKFLESATAMELEAKESLLQLENPQQQEEGGGDVWDLLRKMGVAQINATQNNYYATGDQ